MATQIVKIQMARDTAADWTSNNPTLAEGMRALETDTDRTKTGDGATAWTSLVYDDQLDLVNTFAISSAHNPTTGTITVDLTNYQEVHDIRPTGNDTIDFTNVNVSNMTPFWMRITNGGAHTLSWEVDGVAATSVTMKDAFTFTASGEDECVVTIDEDTNIQIVLWRAGI